MKKIHLLVILAAIFVSCKPKENVSQKIIDCAVAQNEYQLSQMNGKVLNPRTIGKDGATSYINPADWTSGFFPGSMWYMYELTNDEKWLEPAESQTKSIESAKTLTWHHDIGFIIECSYGNGLRLTGEESYKDVIITAANSLITRFREPSGTIQSWNVSSDKQKKRGWQVPVIIDNMMNLELLFHASELTGDDKYAKIAISHADRTLKEHFRPDGSCYHVIDYDSITGEVNHRHTAQGYAHESDWSRGQAWAVYGFTLMYRYTKDEKYLNQAIKTFKFMRDNPNLDADLIPYWDMEAPNIPNEPRDASSAAIIASALYEMELYDDTQGFADYADKLLESLSSEKYMAKTGENNGFILMHSVGSFPGNVEVDVPLNYADYYLLEAVSRKARLSLR